MDVDQGTLWRLVREATTAARAVGALEPIDTVVEQCPDGGVDFQLRTIANVARKQAARAVQTRDPFAPPYEGPLVVGELGPDYVCLLNKFPVFEHHLLIVTRADEPQEAPLTEADCAVALRCLDEGPALLFYNGSRIAGASQPHKHLQLLPLPLAPSTGTPMDLLIRAGAVPFRNAVARPPAEPRALRALIQALLHSAQVVGSAYNLLLTREWLLVVPRVKERFEDISVNALGFVGSLLMKDRAQAARVREVGPMRVLREVVGA